MIRYVFYVVTLAGVMVVGGCATTYEQCDPNKESFLGAANCLMSDEYGYSGRQKRLEGELAVLARRHATLVVGLRQRGRRDDVGETLIGHTEAIGAHQRE